MQARLLDGMRPATLLLLGLAIVSGARKRQSRAAAVKRRECERGECRGVHDDERTNCVLRCQSQQCYAEVYGAEELEPGEIDTKRQQKFNRCLTTEERQQRSKRSVERQQRRAGGDAGSAAADSDAESDAVPDAEDEAKVEI